MSPCHMLTNRGGGVRAREATAATKGSYVASGGREGYLLGPSFSQKSSQVTQELYSNDVKLFVASKLGRGAPNGGGSSRESGP